MSYYELLTNGTALLSKYTTDGNYNLDSKTWRVRCTVLSHAMRRILDKDDAHRAEGRSDAHLQERPGNAEWECAATITCS